MASIDRDTLDALAGRLPPGSLLLDKSSPMADRLHEFEAVTEYEPAPAGRLPFLRTTGMWVEGRDSRSLREALEGCVARHCADWSRLAESGCRVVPR